VDLARDLVRLSGLPEETIDIVFSGARPGEKLYEELYFSEETTIATDHPKLRAAHHRPCTLAEAREEVADLESLTDAPEAIIRQRLQELVPEYQGPREEREEAGQTA